MAIENIEDLESAILRAAQGVKSEIGEEKPIWFRLLRHNPPTEDNPQRGGRKKAYPGPQECWPMSRAPVEEGADPLGPPIQAVVASLRSASAMPGLFSLALLVEEQDTGSGARKWQQIQCETIGELDIKISSEEVEGGGERRAAGGEEGGDVLTPGDRATLSGVLKDREGQFQRRTEIELKHDAGLVAQFGKMAERLETAYEGRERALRLAQEAVSSQYTMANELAASGLKQIETARRAGGELVELQKTSELLAGVHGKQVQVRVLPAAPGQGPLSEVIGLVRDLGTMAIERLPERAPRPALDATGGASSGPAPGGGAAPPPPAPGGGPAPAGGAPPEPPGPLTLTLPQHLTGLSAERLAALLETGYQAELAKAAADARAQGPAPAGGAAPPPPAAGVPVAGQEGGASAG